jgi:hypothetical protein
VGKLSTKLLKPLRIPAGMSGTASLVRDLFWSAASLRP